MNMKSTFILENPDDVAFVEVWDDITRHRWGRIRIRRELNPGVLILEAQPYGEHSWAPMLWLTALRGKLAAKHWFEGGQQVAPRKDPNDSTPIAHKDE